MSWVAWVAVVAGALALVAVGLGLWVWRQQRRLGARLAGPAPAPAADTGRPAGQLVAFVANPSKPDVVELRAAVRKAASEQYLPEPMWLETTVEDPGVGQARSAVESGADLVVAVGGDGTVRAVAEALAGTGVPMGLMPLGTGNLLARNLDVPISDPLAALQLALDGTDKPIDVGWLRVERWESQMDDDIAEAADDLPDDTDKPRDHIFLVIAGLGFDAAMVADTDDGLKAKVGWIAYFMAGVRHLHGRRLRVRLTLDDEPVQQLRARSLLVGNCGKLPGGITLLPDAVLDDGVLDIASIDTRGGIAGWAQLFGEVVLQGVGVRNEAPGKIGRIDHTRARSARIEVAGGEHVQVDGDIVGRASVITARVDPGALVVRVAR
ncbi:NAD(+)/NADH kinase [Cellulomonas sp. zg-ZUI222]|uniref:NAD(+)/NADH kinase n=1 Tax=Cellulomonas wangleii TaxID=2816956 RepID=A0ABX8D3E5_9CELL|nr:MULTISPECIES: diacylglycerol kinase family protein [Cellulomonas]MBO0899049.1 NAD(+)/NADH kinase [Cellulomonas sp. zg-ZUI22]MBO0919902.1 NAD(+)/NADH kinase [Cellulomonas wangleii]MBO0923669.1 NAD(+)/NADH kinase [Cellulomonas wangleii]QVI61987.1 NAD(+)/NADH kinase [Cellulomonas wangleii]